jgi:hypothetical protein
MCESGNVPFKASLVWRRNETEKNIGDQEHRIRPYTQYETEALRPEADGSRLHRQSTRNLKI